MQAAALVYKVICAQTGKLDLGQLTDNLSGQIRKDELEEILGNKQLFVVCSLDGKKMIIAKTQLKLCKARDCNSCSNLHLCKLYLFGEDCPHNRGRRVCRFSHDLYSDHNSQVLQQHCLQGLHREELCTLLLQNDNTLVPQICFGYNRGTGVFGSCPRREACWRLHICQKYLRGTCHTGHCDKSHDFFEPQPKRLLQSKGVETVQSLLSMYQNIQAIWDSDHSPGVHSRGGPKGTEICLFYIKNYCKDGDRCEQVHFNLPYKWEFKDGQGWSKFTDDDNEATEKDYCDPSKTYSGRNVPVHFDTMTRKFVAVRRISTVSSVIQPNFILTTKWVWYWQDESGQWTPYGSSKGAHSLAPITSEDLEKTYQKDNKAIIEFTTNKHTYKLNMQDMVQCNSRFGTKRLVRRRPFFVSAADVQNIKSSSVHTHRDMPPEWDKADMPETGFKRVKLESYSKEYVKIAELFNKTMPDFRVTSIERVQNLGLWEVFQWQVKQLKKKNSGNANEIIAFHGTDSKHIDNICRENVDWRVCGTHRTSYGEGSYFARDAKRSHNYTSPSATRSMFACRVLLGEYTLGNSKYKVPPPKEDDPRVFYDSCVNRISDPSIFVVFERHQIYPEYLIQYTETTQSRPVQVSQYIPSQGVSRQSSSYVASPLSSSAWPGSKTNSSSFNSKLVVTSHSPKKIELHPVSKEYKLRCARLNLLFR